VRGGDGEDPLVVGEHTARDEVWFVNGEPVAQDIDIAPAQRAVGIEGPDFGKPDLAGRVARLKCGGELAERRPFGGEHEPDAQQPADRPGQLAGLGQNPVQGGEHGGEVPPERFTRWRQADPAAGPVEDLDAQPGLQHPHRLAHPGLGDTQPLGRPAEVQLVGQREKDPQLT
jgi:hypothetical protein